MASLIAARDWSRTPLGAMDGWSHSLRGALNICLRSRFQMAIYWGRELVCLYNDAERAVLGAMHPGALGKPARELLADSWAVVGPQLEAVMTSGASTWSEDQPLVVDRTGAPETAYFTYAYSPILDDDGGIGGVLLVTYETTQRVRAERWLQALRIIGTEALNARTPLEVCALSARNLADHAGLEFVLVYLTRDDGRRAVCAACEGRSRQPEPRHAVVEMDGTGPLGDALRALSSDHTTPRPLSAGDVVRAANGEPPDDARAIVAPIRHVPAAAITGFLVIGYAGGLTADNAHLGFAEMVGMGLGRSLAAARAREAERDRTRSIVALDQAKTALFSNTSHELRTPLSLILGPLEQLLDQEMLTPSARGQLTLVRRNAMRMLKLVNALLDFSRIAAGERVGAFAATDLAQVTRDVTAMFASTAESAGLELSVDAPPLPEPVYVDGDAWETIVSNLVSNALKFTPTGAIRVRLRPQAGHAVLTVTDTGIGIAPEEVRMVFSRFYRARSARGPGYDGTGIGLALVRELVHLHGGAIDARSALDEGTEVMVRIPLGHSHLESGVLGEGTVPATSGRSAALLVEEVRDRNAARPLPVSSDQDPVPGAPSAPLAETQRSHVLVVEDNADMQGYLRRLLSPYHRVQVAADGVQALRLALADPPDAIVADVMMPALDGFGLVRSLRLQARTRTLPVMLVSARADPESSLQALELGADDYLVKPFGARELITRVQAMLERSTMRADQAEARGRARERATRIRELEGLHRDLRAAQRRAAVAGDAERQRIETNLHDGAQQRLMAIRLELGLLSESFDGREPGARAELERLRSELDGALEELRELAHGLYPPLLASDGLRAAISAAARRGTLPVDVEAPDFGRLPRPIENAAYFCCLEALQNAAKHAGEGAAATVSLAIFADTLRFRVSDNGCGFDRTAVSEGHGLTNLSDRLEALGGGAEVSSVLGEGTTVTGWIPLTDSEDD